MPPHSVRPAPEEGTPKASPKRAAKKAAAPPSPPPVNPPRLAPGDADLRAKLIQTYQTAGTLTMGAGYMRANPGLALAGCNAYVMAEESADADLAMAKRNPKFRAFLLRFVEVTATGEFISNKLAILAPVVAALVPHPFATAIANQAVKPAAHLMALESFPDLFAAAAANAAAAAAAAAMPDEPSENATDGQL